jgi:hypothetical protein
LFKGLNGLQEIKQDEKDKWLTILLNLDKKIKETNVETFLYIIFKPSTNIKPLLIAYSILVA